MTPNTDKLYKGEVISKAHQIRREAAQQAKLPTRAVSWKSCLTVAAKGTKKINDAWGCRLNSELHTINRFLWSGECPVNVDQGSISDATGISKTYISKYVTDLVDCGYLVVSKTGWMSVNHESRPFPHPTPEEEDRYSLV